MKLSIHMFWFRSSFLILLIARLTSSDPAPCTPETAASCVLDEYVGSTLLYEDTSVRVWDMTLEPGQMTSMHRHNCQYYFTVISPTELEIYLRSGERSFSFQAEGTMGFQIVGDNLVQIGVENPIVVSRTHAARNIGNGTYKEILFESKDLCSKDNPEL